MSEIMRLRARIEEEIEAMKRAMNGFAVVASHEAITHHYERLDACLEQLAGRVGEQAAIETLIAELEARL
jgi:pyruvate/oxaloacetate carboxyltransferase